MKDEIVIGLMSGTSLDGLDIAACRFNADSFSNYEFIAGETISYSKRWKDRLQSAMQLSTTELLQLDVELGDYFGHCVLAFMQKHKIKSALVASHGHTVFHQPDKKFTLQIGNGSSIAVASKCITVFNFRVLDIALGGQGAPLVPIGDELLFGAYDSCLNIGGIANISLRKRQQRIAYDICPANMAINSLVNELGKEYDENGKFGSTGQVDSELLSQLNQLPFYQKDYPRSLGKEWFDQAFKPLLTNSTATLVDRCATVYAHIAEQVAHELNRFECENCLVSGGGAYNQFLVASIQKKTNCKLVIPNDTIIQFKEAIVFALLGYLRLNNHINTYASVTGAIADSSGGWIAYPH